MSTHLDHDRTVGLLAEEFAAIDQLCAPLPEDAWDTPTCLPGWSVRDNLSHMVGTESMLAGVEPPSSDVSHLDHMKNPIAEANEAWVESMRQLAGTEVLDRFRRVTRGRLAALGAMTQADFDAPSWTPAGPDETYGRFMRIRHYDCFMHEHDMRGALGLADRPAPDHVRSSLDEVATGLGYIVGRRARMPAGSSVRIALTGPVTAEYLVEVAERATVVEHLDGTPTVQVTLPAMLFLRLTGGRQAGAPELGRAIAVEGDAALAEQLVSRLAFTI